MTNTEEFKNIVDRTYKIRDILPIANSSDIYEKIRKLSSGNLQEMRKSLLIWRRDLLAHKLYHRETLFPYMNIVNLLWDVLREKTSTVTTKTNWQLIIEIVITNQYSFSYFFSQKEEEILKFHPKEVATAISARRLNSIGYPIKIVEGNYRLGFEGKAKVELEIDRLCKLIGGEKLFNFLLNSIEKKYDSLSKRYHLTREITKDTPQIPWGYILQLSAKYIAIPSSKHYQKMNLEELISMITDAIALYEIQPYSPYEGLFIEPENIPKFLADSVQYDAIFTIPQLRDNDLQSIYNILLKNFNTTVLFCKNVTVNSCIRVFSAVRRIAKEEMSVIFTANEISEILNTKNEVIRNILETYLVHSPNGANQEMKFPPLSDKIDFGSRPILKLSTEKYYIPPKSISNPAFFNALEEIYREAVGGSFDSDLGLHVESYLRQEFNKRKINIKHGKYWINKKTGYECDIVVETETHILFLEVKKKVLTNEGKCGNIRTFVDLARSFLYAQIQAMQHHLQIIKNGKIKLLTPTNEYVIQLNNRKVDRISVSLKDFGSLHNKVTIETFLKLCYQFDLKEVNEADKDVMEEIHNEIQKLRMIFNELNNVSSEKSDLLCLPAYFISVPQILILLDDVTKSEEFHNKLRSSSCILTERRDFYSDNAFSKLFLK